MKVTLGALTKLHEDWQGVDNFYLFFQLDIEFEDNKKGYESFSFTVVSPKRLETLIPENGIEIGRGYIIMNNFDIQLIEKKIKHIIEICSCESINQTIANLSKFFIYETDNI